MSEEAKKVITNPSEIEADGTVALMEVRKCEFCNKLHFAADVTYGYDPYSYELYEDESLWWACSDCLADRRGAV